jgi:hypothetical protein
MLFKESVNLSRLLDIDIKHHGTLLWAMQFYQTGKHSFIKLLGQVLLTIQQSLLIYCINYIFIVYRLKVIQVLSYSVRHTSCYVISPLWEQANIIRSLRVLITIEDGRGVCMCYRIVRRGSVSFDAYCKTVYALYRHRQMYIKLDIIYVYYKVYNN